MNMSFLGHMLSAVMTLPLLGAGRLTAPNIKYLPDGESGLQLTARSAVLMEPLSGEILYEKDSRVRLYPASMTKMMGMTLVLEAIDAGKLTWDEEVTVSDTAKSMGGTQIYLEPGEKMKTIDLFKSVSINSANDAIVALGERVSGSLPAFVGDMNKKAAELGMEDTHFNNATGFDDPEHYTSALDMAKCARELLSHGEDILRFTRLKEGYVREDTPNPFWLVNTNKMLGAYLGMDGLKTGYTNLAGYNLTATASRDGVRLVSVVMKEPSIKERSKDTAALLDYGFSKMERLPLYPAGEKLAEYAFKKTLGKPQGLYLRDEASAVVLRGKSKDDFRFYIRLDRDEAPIAEGEVVGSLVAEDRKSGEVLEYPIVVREAIPAYSFGDYWLYNIGKLLA